MDTKYKVIEFNRLFDRAISVISQEDFAQLVLNATNLHAKAVSICSSLPDPSDTDLQQFYETTLVPKSSYYNDPGIKEKTIRGWKSELFTGGRIFKTVATNGKIFKVCGGKNHGNVYYTFLSQKKITSREGALYDSADDASNVHAEMKLLNAMNSRPAVIGVSQRLCTDGSRHMKSCTQNLKEGALYKIAEKKPIFVGDGNANGVSIFLSSPNDMFFDRNIPYLCEFCRRRVAISRKVTKIKSPPSPIWCCRICGIGFGRLRLDGALPKDIITNVIINESSYVTS